MKAPKQILTFLLLVLVIGITTRFAVFSGYIHSKKVELCKSTLLQQHVQVKKIIFSEEELFLDKGIYEWKEHNKELVINGSYHEVLSVHKINRGFVVAVVEDKVENDLLKHFFKKNKTAQETANSLLQLLQLQYPVPSLLVLNAPYSQFYNYQQASQPSLCLGYSSFPLLPPRTC